MSVALDHVSVCCAVGAPEAEALARVGLKEGTPNTHPGQGTACRRFFFANAYLELFWVEDAAAARSETVRPTRLFERWSQRGKGACPYGIVLRPAEGAVDPRPPFLSWAYRPSYLPGGLAIEIARDTPLHEPELFFLAFQRGRARNGEEPVRHDLPISELRGITISMPGGALSAAAQALRAAAPVVFREADHYLMELTFDQAAPRSALDLRPGLPLALRW